MGHDKLGNVYKTNFALMNHHKWNLSDLEDMMPWERYIYVDLLQAFLREQEEQRRLQEQEMQAKIRQSQRRRQ